MIAVLLINLGTPQSAEVPAVRAFLKEFLDDSHVIALPRVIRKLLLHFFILPFRPKQSAKAYAAIWDEEKGSPLLTHSMNLAKDLQQQLGQDYLVTLGMRYQKPSIQAALEVILQSDCKKLIVLPLFPQYSNAANGSAIDKLKECLKPVSQLPELRIFREFYQIPAYIAAQASLIKSSLTHQDGILFSYHSLPVSHIKKTASHCAAHCFANQPCNAIKLTNQKCYRAQCYETSRLLAEYLDLQHYEVAFQSRLGRTVWIGPDVKTTMQKMRAQGIKNLLVACPSFVADCLETLEEIGIQGKRQWQALGGEEFTLVPCMNADPVWVKAAAEMIQSA